MYFKPPLLKLALPLVAGLAKRSELWHACRANNNQIHIQVAWQSAVV